MIYILTVTATSSTWDKPNSKGYDEYFGVLPADDYRRYLPSFEETTLSNDIHMSYWFSKDPDNPGHAITFEKGDDRHLMVYDTKEEVMEMLELLNAMTISVEEFYRVLDDCRYSNQNHCCPWHMQTSKPYIT